MTMSSLLETLLDLCEEFEASDLHISVGLAPRFRIRGALVPKGNFKPFDMQTVDELTMELGLYTLPIGCPDGTERVRLTLARDGTIDGALTSPSGSRYRFNLYRSNDRHAIALRRLDARFRSFGELGLPPRLADFCNENDGLVVVTGPTGSGKSTTLATVDQGIDGIDLNAEALFDGVLDFGLGGRLGNLENILMHIVARIDHVPHGLFGNVRSQQDFVNFTH